MRKLKESQSNDGIIIHLLDRIGEYALVSNHTIDGNHFGGFEVHLIEERQKHIASMGGHRIVFPAHESYVPSYRFGFRAFHYPNLALVYIDYPQFEPHNDKILKKLALVVTK